MAEKAKAVAKPVNPLDQELLQKAAVHTEPQTTAEKALAVSQVVEKPVSHFAANGINPYAEDPAYQTMKTIYMPLARAGESPNATIELNGVKWKIPRGRPVVVPRPVYEQFERILDAEVAEINMHAQMAASADMEHFGMGYRLGEQPI